LAVTPAAGIVSSLFGEPFRLARELKVAELAARNTASSEPRLFAEFMLGLLFLVLLLLSLSVFLLTGSGDEWATELTGAELPRLLLA
jgi:hypothetical protein